MLAIADGLHQRVVVQPVHEAVVHHVHVKSSYRALQVVAREVGAVGVEDLAQPLRRTAVDAEDHGHRLAVDELGLRANFGKRGRVTVRHAAGPKDEECDGVGGHGWSRERRWAKSIRACVSAWRPEVSAVVRTVSFAKGWRTRLRLVSSELLG